jgi:signal peptidase II
MRLSLCPERKRQLFWIAGITLLVVLCDQVTKYLVMKYIPEGSETLGSHPQEFFWITHQRNEGLVGGMFRDSRLVPFIAPLFATVVLAYLYTHLNPKSRWQSLAYGLVAGGAVGNLIDRFRLGSVTDFLQFHFHFVKFDFPWKLYPAFNVADSAICTGVVLLIILTWKNPQPESQEDAHVSNAG